MRALERFREQMALMASHRVRGSQIRVYEMVSSVSMLARGGVVMLSDVLSAEAACDGSWRASSWVTSSERDF